MFVNHINTNILHNPPPPPPTPQTHLHACNHIHTYTHTHTHTPTNPKTKKQVTVTTTTTNTCNKYSSSGSNAKTTLQLSHLPELCLEVECSAALPEEGSLVLLNHVAIGVRFQCWGKLQSKKTGLSTFHTTANTYRHTVVFTTPVEQAPHSTNSTIVDKLNQNRINLFLPFFIVFDRLSVV